MPIFTRFADAVAEALARPGTFVIAIALVATWAISGPLFSFSDTWLLAINTGTMLSTFLMVFLLQHTQARDNAAIHAKLDELIRVLAASDRQRALEGKPNYRAFHDPITRRTL